MIPNPQSNVMITDAGGNTLYYSGQAYVDLDAQPQVVAVWGGSRAPGVYFYYGQIYYLQGNPSLGNRTAFWWKDSDDVLYFAIDNS